MIAAGAVERLEGRLRAASRGRLLRDEPLAAWTSFRVGGPADLLFFPGDREDLAAALRLAAEEGVPVHVMGNGTNLVVLDGGLRGLVVRLSSLAGIRGGDPAPGAGKGDPVALAALAGTPLSKVVNHAVSRGLAGIEFAAGIPGTLGGAVAMNAGAHGRSVGDLVAWVETLDASGGIVRVPAGQIVFAYRSTRLPHPGFIVEVGLELRVGSEPEVLEAVKRCHQEHRRRLPFGWGNAGSVFKNPPGDHAGRLVEAAGLKGRRVGGAEVSAKHANVIVNVGQATAADVVALIGEIVAAVRERFGVELEPEVQVVGEETRR